MESSHQLVEFRIGQEAHGNVGSIGFTFVLGSYLASGLPLCQDEHCLLGSRYARSPVLCRKCLSQVAVNDIHCCQARGFGDKTGTRWSCGGRVWQDQVVGRAQERLPCQAGNGLRTQAKGASFVFCHCRGYVVLLLGKVDQVFVWMGTSRLDRVPRRRQGARSTNWGRRQGCRSRTEKGKTLAEKAIDCKAIQSLGCTCRALRLCCGRFQLEINEHFCVMCGIAWMNHVNEFVKFFFECFFKLFPFNYK